MSVSSFVNNLPQFYCTRFFSICKYFFQKEEYFFEKSFHNLPKSAPERVQKPANGAVEEKSADKKAGKVAKTHISQAYGETEINPYRERAQKKQNICQRPFASAQRAQKSVQKP
jgi:hypothetical protein